MSENSDKDQKDTGWSTSAKVGAAIGSAAILAGLLYAGRNVIKRKVEPQSPGDEGSAGQPPPPDGEQYESD